VTRLPQSNQLKESGLKTEYPEYGAILKLFWEKDPSINMPRNKKTQGCFYLFAVKPPG
jgi:hypothetical protein